ncbi:biosynthetic-type acetolactate synthase large subunit [Candidatus Acetothermia bacterium]|nr:biosynthetic-type acetolactate synthase large subunit [Candidatus Acetothermia bacterium]
MSLQTQSVALQTAPPKRIAADVVVEALKAEGVKVIFGMTGGAIMPLYDALFRDGSIQHITIGHEQGGTHMAEGYARVTGQVGVILTTSGPGATNLVTGLTDAYMDSLPIVALTGQVPTRAIGTNAFQEAPITEITRPITKRTYLVRQADDLARIIPEAFHLARSGRPGPVLIDLPKDVLSSSTSASFVGPWRNDHTVRALPDPTQIQEAVRALVQAKRPIILAGGGVLLARASHELRELAERLRIPVTTTHMAVGCFPEDSSLSLQSLGMHGTAYANKAVPESDLLIAIGTRLSDRATGNLQTFAPYAKVIHIDVDAKEIGAKLPTHIGIVADAQSALRALNRATRTLTLDHSAWLSRIAQLKREYPMRYVPSDHTIKPQYAVQVLRELTQRDAIVATDVGQHQMWVLQYYTFTEPDTNLTSGGLGTMGFGFPAAMGAKIAKPERQVICVSGDGSFLMNVQELNTAVRERLNVIVLVFNNRALGMVRQWNHFFYQGRYAESLLHSPAFDRIAEAFGAKGLRAERPDELRSVLREALSYKDGPVVVDVHIDPEENVFPMVPPGGSNAQCWLKAEDAHA